MDGQPVAQLWTDLDETLTFFYGRSYDEDPRGYASLMDKVYGNKVSVLALADEGQWQVFRVLAQTLPQTKAYTALSTAVSGLSGNLPDDRGWYFLGRRFPPDNIALKTLPLFRDETSGLPHQTPSGLDWMSILGSQRAQQVLDSRSVTQSEAYRTQLGRLQLGFQSQTQPQWLSTIFGVWSYTYLPRISDRQNPYPSFMRSPDWAQKDLNTSLGSWVETHYRTGLDALTPIIDAAKF